MTSSQQATLYDRKKIPKLQMVQLSNAKEIKKQKNLKLLDFNIQQRNQRTVCKQSILSVQKDNIS